MSKLSYRLFWLDFRKAIFPILAITCGSGAAIIAFGWEWSVNHLPIFFGILAIIFLFLALISPLLNRGLQRIWRRWYSWDDVALAYKEGCNIRDAPVQSDAQFIKWVIDQTHWQLNVIGLLRQVGTVTELVFFTASREPKTPEQVSWEDRERSRIYRVLDSRLEALREILEKHGHR